MLQPQALESEDLLGCHLALQFRLQGAVVVQVLVVIVALYTFLKNWS